MKTLLPLLAFFCATAHAQYTVTDVAPPDYTIASLNEQGLDEVYLASGLYESSQIETIAEAQSGSILVGYYENAGAGMQQAVVWLNGINNPATDLNNFVQGLGLSEAFAIDGSGDIFADNAWRSNPQPAYFELSPSQAPELDPAQGLAATALLVGMILILRSRGAP
jgi:hypothetical protein